MFVDVDRADVQEEAMTETLSELYTRRRFLARWGSPHANDKELRSLDKEIAAEEERRMSEAFVRTPVKGEF